MVVEEQLNCLETLLETGSMPPRGSVHFSWRMARRDCDYPRGAARGQDRVGGLKFLGREVAARPSGQEIIVQVDLRQVVPPYA